MFYKKKINFTKKVIGMNIGMIIYNIYYLKKIDIYI